MRMLADAATGRGDHPATGTGTARRPPAGPQRRDPATAHHHAVGGLRQRHEAHPETQMASTIMTDTMN